MTGEARRADRRSESGRAANALDIAAGIAWWIAFGERVWDVRHEIVRAPLFERPALVPKSDLTTSSIVRECSRRKRAPKDKQEIANAFWQWRNAIVEAEARDEGNIVALLTIAHHSAQAPEGTGIARRLIEHVREQWGAVVPWPPPPPLELQEVARRAARNEDLLPTWMLLGERPPKHLLGDSAVLPPGDETDENGGDR